MKRKFACTGACLCLLAFTFSIVLSAQGQSAQASAIPAGPLSYDATREVTIKATVLTPPRAADNGGFRAKRQLTLETSGGTIAAEVGRTALRGKFAIPFSSGQEVQVTGVMTSRSGSQVMLVRTVQLDGHTYTVRNALGSVLLHPIVDGTATLAFKGGAQ